MQMYDECVDVVLGIYTFKSSINDGNPPIDMNVTNPDTYDVQAPLALRIQKI
jgi:hypothetical protein